MSLKFYIILSFAAVLLLGLISLIRRARAILRLLTFAVIYKNNFIEFTNKYATSYDRYSRTGDFDYSLYTWLTKNVNQIQSDLGHIGIMNYIAPFQTFQVPNYQIIINTLPKFREGKITDFDVNACDDCFLRHIGSLENILEKTRKKIKNPLVWFKEGFQQIFNLPVYILNWFGVLSDKNTKKVIASGLYKVISGIGGFVTFISGLVTIIQGKDHTIEIIKKIWHH